MRRPFMCLMLVLVANGCKRSASVTAPATAPASQPTAVAVNAPTTQPVGPTFMLVGQESIQFPPARVVVKQPGDKLSAMLFSVDPPEAIKTQYRGNSFYFDMPDLNLEDPASINNAVWSFRAPDSDRQDSNDGLFIGGRQFQLQPFEVQVLIEGDQSPARVKLSGTFLKFDNNSDQTLGTRVNVRAEFDAEVRK